MNGEFLNLIDSITTAAAPYAGKRRGMYFRLKEVALRLKELSAAWEHVPLTPVAEERSLAVTQHLAAALNAYSEGASAQVFFEAIIQADVELDYLEFPEVDPVAGWVAEQDPGKYERVTAVVDTQLARWYLGGSGAISELDYKPLKLNVTGRLPGESALHFTFSKGPSASVFGSPLSSAAASSTFGTDFPETDPPVQAEQKVTIKARSIVTVRSIQPRSGSQFPARVFSDITFKSGVGAHLANATTGFAISYWVEPSETLSDGTMLNLQFKLALPSRTAEVSLATPLLCVGGVAEHAIPCSEPVMLGIENAPGGLFGVRMTDAINGFTMDLRSAKQLDAAHIRPIMSAQGEAEYLLISMQTSAMRLLDDSRANTLFFRLSDGPIEIGA